MKSKDEQIHELEQQVSDMAMEITRLKKITTLYKDLTSKQDKLIEKIMSLDNRWQEAAQSHQSSLTLPDH